MSGACWRGRDVCCAPGGKGGGSARISSSDLSILFVVVAIIMEDFGGEGRRLSTARRARTGVRGPARLGKARIPRMLAAGSRDRRSRSTRKVLVGGPARLGRARMPRKHAAGSRPIVKGGAEGVRSLPGPAGLDGDCPHSGHVDSRVMDEPAEGSSSRLCTPKPAMPGAIIRRVTVGADVAEEQLDLSGENERQGLSEDTVDGAA